MTPTKSHTERQPSIDELDRELLVSLIAQIDGVEAVVEDLHIADSSFQESPSEITLHL